MAVAKIRSVSLIHGIVSQHKIFEFRNSACIRDVEPRKTHCILSLSLCHLMNRHRSLTAHVAALYAVP
jgi:hypothetical protein